MDKVNVFIEIEKNSNIRYVFDKNSNELVIQRIIDKPYTYPYPYGFITNSETDYNKYASCILLIDDNDNIKNNTHYDAYIIGALVMETEKGMNEKFICVLNTEKYKDIFDLTNDVKKRIYLFFQNYRQNNFKKWSNIIGFINKYLSVDLFSSYTNKYNKTNNIQYNYLTKNNLVEYNIENDMNETMEHINIDEEDNDEDDDEENNNKNNNKNNNENNDDDEDDDDDDDNDNKEISNEIITDKNINEQVLEENNNEQVLEKNNTEEVLEENNNEQVFEENNNEQVFEENNTEQIFEENNNEKVFEENNTEQVFEENNTKQVL